MAEKLVLIGAVWPEPKSSAGGTRLMQLIQYFQSWKYEIIYCSAAAPSEFAVNLKDVNVQSKKIELNNSSFDRWLKEQNPEVVIFDRFMVEEQFSWRVREACPNAIRVIETIDLHCLRKARQKAVNTGEAMEEILMSSEESFREIAAILRSDLSLLISRDEMKILQSVFKVDSSLLHYLPYEAPLQSGENPSFGERADFLSLGNFKHGPNWDAVLWLKKEIWPLIRTQLPGVKLNICGAYPEEKVFQLHSEKEGFIVKGRVEDALKEMKQARVLLAPLRFGAGIKGKLVESLLCGTPNVTTEIGIEGIGTSEKWNGFVAESAQEIAEKAVQLYRDEMLWAKSQEAGYLLLKEKFATQSDREDLKVKLQSLHIHAADHRKKNFYGNMLNHHQFQSTKYFSKWIEEKNR